MAYSIKRSCRRVAGAPYLPPPPVVDEAAWADSSRELLFVESPIKALAVAHHLKTAVIGLAGVSTGGETGENRLHPELRQRVALDGRRVVILFDSNRLKPQVRKAEKTLARQLHAVGASVFIAALPSIEGEDVGPDDFCRLLGANPLQKVVSEALPWRERLSTDIPSWIDELERTGERVYPLWGT
ncbi:MAG: DUF3854 domain-containing protein [Leptolyngbyaceae cyanobacterium SM2_5_2]|nr:DUF3854 domain-containing protein [Leptolyngbyaceae cyanobacterium SM2_5_2]